MSSVKTMACPYGHGKWRNSSNDSKLNCTGIVCSRIRPPLIRLDSTGEVKTTGFISQQQHTFDSKMPHYRKSNSMLNIRDWIVGKVVNTRSNLTMSDRHSHMDTVSFNNSVRYNTMPQTRPLAGQPSVSHSANRWHQKIPYISFQHPRFNGDFRIFPCHQFEFYNNIKNNMDMHVMGPFSQQNLMGFQNGPPDQNVRGRNKHVHMPPRKVLKRERDSVPSSQGSNSRQQPSNCSGDNVDSPSKSQTVCSSSQQCTVNKIVQNENTRENVQPHVDLELSDVKDEFKKKCNDVTSTDIKMETSGNVTNCTADDASVLKGDSDSLTESLIDGLTNIVLNDVNIGKTCLAAEKRKIQEEAHISEAAESTNDVLLLRKPCKKGRPSAKKQRKRKRQRARLCESAKTNEICDINNKTQGSNPAQNEKPSKCQNSCKQQFGCSTIAFILGLHSVTDNDVVDSFSDSGEDSDFCDMDECDIAAAFRQCNLTSVLPQHSKPKLHSTDVASQPDVGVNTAKLDAINSTWNIQISKDITDARETKRLKKVNFNDDHLVTVHQADKWSRKGPWEDYARDRQRFQRRITECEGILSPILTPQHRAAVFLMHYSNS